MLMVDSLNAQYKFLIIHLFIYLFDMELHQDRAFWTHPWGVNPGYMTPSTRTMYQVIQENF